VVKRQFPLVAVLSALALGAAGVRVIAQWQVLVPAGAMPASRLLLLEAGNWTAWTAWAAILALVAARLDDSRWQGARRAATVSLLAVAPIVTVPILTAPLHWLVTDSPGVGASGAHVAGHNLPTNLLLGVAMVAVWRRRAGRERTRALETTAADLRAQLAEAQLAVLRAQLDPHFLFNALNSATVLARRGAGDDVARLLTHLAALLRHSLDAAANQVVPLRVELEVLGHYLDIERVRHGDRLVVHVTVAPGLQDHPVPSLLLQPLVENSILHGFTDPSRPLTIAVGVGRDGDALTITVQDDGAGVPTAPGAPPAERIGLGNTRARLDGLYGAAAALRMAPAPGGRGTRVTVVVPSTELRAGRATATRGARG
jgi:hypothetical protein